MTIFSPLIRPAAIRDLEVLASFNSAMALETEGTVLLPEVITAGVRAVLLDVTLGRYFVAEIDGQVVGALMLTTEWSDWRNGLFWWIQSVYVRPAFRQKGVYRSLHQHVRELCASDPEVCGLRLYVERDNQRAQQTYQKLGMQPTHYVLFEELKPGIRFRRDD